MSFLSVFRSERLAPEWSYQAGGVIWRILFSDRSRIVGERRSSEEKVASFFCLDEQSGKPLWKDLRLEEPWWIGIETIIGDTLLLHSYTAPDMPEHRGMQAFDMETGRLRWRNDEATFWFHAGNRLFGYRDFFERRVGYEIDPQSGDVTRTYDDSLQVLHDMRRQAQEEPGGHEMRFPEILPAEGGEPKVRTLVSRAMKSSKIVGNIEFVEEEDLVSFNFHVGTRNRDSGSPALENHLMVYRISSGKKVFSDVIGRNLRAYVPDSFFVRRPRLFYIKEQSVLTALRLWK